VADVAVGVIRHDDPQVLADERGREHVAVRRLADLLPGELIERGLRIETLHVAHAANQEDPDHALGLRAQVGQAVGRCPGRGGLGPAYAVARQHGPQRQAGESHTDIGQKGSAIGPDRWLVQTLVHCSSSVS